MLCLAVTQALTLYQALTAAPGGPDLQPPPLERLSVSPRVETADAVNDRVLAPVGQRVL